MDASEALQKDKTKNSKNESKPVMIISWRKYGTNKHINKSGTDRLITRYVPGFLKHCKGSLIKATRSNTFETAPRKAIIKDGNLLYLNSILVILFSAMILQYRVQMLISSI
jgi:hypothetical protein